VLNIVAVLERIVTANLYKMQQSRTAVEAAAQDLLKACELGDAFGCDGPELLRRAAALLARGAPKLAFALQCKAEVEQAAIAIARGSMR